jgi:hypothetical protein
MDIQAVAAENRVVSSPLAMKIGHSDLELAFTVKLSPDQVTQIQTEMITRLLTVVNGLRNDMSAIQIENANLQQKVNTLQLDLRAMQQSFGAKFYLFQRLPTELRCMIWRFARDTPGVYKVSRDFSSHKRRSYDFTHHIENSCDVSCLQGVTKGGNGDCSTGIDQQRR